MNFKKPLNPFIITSNYGWRIHPITKERKFHNGIDLKGYTGQPIFNISPGVVLSSYYNTAGGNQIIIQHDNSNTMINTAQFQLQGRHNLLNAMAAVTIARLLKVSKDSIRESLMSFKGAPHRLEQFLKIQNISYINDSKATNVNATFYALDSVNSQTVWIAGGVDKGNDYNLLLPLVREKV